MKPIHVFAVIAAIGAFGQEMRAEVRITELMQSNITCVFDDLKDYPDSWVELYNDGSQPVTLNSYSIGIKKSADKAWTLPATTLKAGEYALVFCDKAETKMHTSFRLESDKSGKVYLFKNGVAIQTVEHPAQPAPDTAYGVDDYGAWGFELTPTPGRQNCGMVVSGERIAEAPTFSYGGAVNPLFNEVYLYLSGSAPAGATIRYTTDGTIPTEESPVANEESPISLTNGFSTVIRARTFAPGLLPSATVTHSYLSHHIDQTLPIVSMAGSDDDLFDASIGILGKNNYQKDWRRPVNVEFFEPTEVKAVINQLCETRVGGGWSRCLDLKSMMVYANKRFGVKRLNHEFFPDQKPGLDTFKSVMLRNAGNDYYETYMRDGIVQRVVGRNADVDWQAFQPAVLYINGNYMGMLNLRERSNDDNIFSNYGGLEDIDMIENWTELKVGTMDNFNVMLNMIQSQNNTAEQLRSVFDVDEILDVHLFNLFFNNTDFPGNNIVLWRPRAEGGRWRIVIKDTDYAMGIIRPNYDSKLPPTFNTIEWLHTPGYKGGGNNWGNPSARTRLFRRLMDVAEIRDRFFDRAFVEMGDFLNYREVCEQIDLVDDMMTDEWERHDWKYVNSRYGSRAENVEWMRSWIKQRTPRFYDMLATYYNLAPLVDLTIERGDLDITFNGLPLHRELFEGKYESGRRASLHVEAPENFEAIWSCTTPDSIIRHRGSDFVFTPTSRSSVSVRLEDVWSDRIVSPEQSAAETVEYYDLTGRRISAGEAMRQGLYIVRTGSRTEKRIIRGSRRGL